MKKSEKNLCTTCTHFQGYDGIGELWTGCSYGDFQGTRINCSKYKKKTTKADLHKKIKELEEDNARLKQRIRDLNNGVGFDD